MDMNFFLWNKGCQIYMEKISGLKIYSENIRGLKIMGFSEENTPVSDIPH